MEKPFRTYDEQIEILKGRGMVIEDATVATEILANKNYYNIINGYKRLFLDPSSTAENEHYMKGTMLHEIDSLFLFDSNLRIVCLKRILEVELRMKSIIAYEFSKRYGYDDNKYLDPVNFSAAMPEQKSLDKMLKTVDDQRADAMESDNSSILHYVNEHGYVPLWVLMNVLTFGAMAHFYASMKLADRASVAKRFPMDQSELNKILRALNYYRNCCAHGGRFYDFKVLRHPIPLTDLHKRLHLVYDRNLGYVPGQNDFFALIIILQLFVHQSDFQETIREVSNLLGTLEHGLHTVSITQVEKMMGLPQGWDKLVTT